jgi:hypothetical protein
VAGAGLVAEAAATFFTFSDASYFLGTVVALNSLRLSGNRGKLVVVDGGLAPAQRLLLSSAATVVDLPADVASTHALTVKPSVFHFEPEGVVVLLDSDMIVTRNVGDHIQQAREGKIVAFPDHTSKYGRWFAEWEELFQLAAAPRRQRYVNAGFVALSVDRWPNFLPRWYRAASRIPPERIQRDVEDAAWAADQDALNAILMSEIAPEELAIGPEWESIHPDGLRQVRVADPATLACTYKGKSTTVLHFSLGPKPWQRGAWRRIAAGNAYVSLMPRILFGDDVPIRVRPEGVPVWGRTGARARAVSDALGRVVGGAQAAKRLALKARDLIRP